jgi:hypothetical protein
MLNFLLSVKKFRGQRRLIKVTTVSIVLGLVTVASPAAASPTENVATASSKKCSALVSPVTKIPGFKLVQKTCDSSTFRGASYVFTSNRKFSGQDISSSPSEINRKSANQISKAFQSLGKRYKKTWFWNSVNPKGVTYADLWNKNPECLDPFSSSCSFQAIRVDDKNQRVFASSTQVEWNQLDCFAGGWIPCDYRLQFTVYTNEDFWE